MRVEIIHLSDIHFKKAGNPVGSMIDALARAVTSVDALASLFLFVLSGDIASSGKWSEYQTAIQFFCCLEKKLKEFRPEVAVEYVSVPGNHDCLLPEMGVKLRETLIRGALPSMREATQDGALLSQLLKAQVPYNRFRKRLGRVGDWDGLCETVTIEHESKKINVHLYNTALLSQRVERQGELHLPVRRFEDRILYPRDSALCISVFHHSYVWLESNVVVGFRNHIEKTSDMALSGHQHYNHDFYKQNSTGERVLYLEAGALQDEKYPLTSSFQVLVIDFETQQYKSTKFRRSRDLYSRSEETDWGDLALNKTIRTGFRFSEKFDTFLNESGTPLTHKIRGTLKLRDVFVFPDLVVRPAGAKTKPREIRGDEFLAYASHANRVVFQGPSLGGKTSLSKVICWEVFRRGMGVPLWMTGRQLTSPEERKVVPLLWKTFNEQYGDHQLDDFQQIGKERWVLIVDDWHCARLNPEGRKVLLLLLSNYFGKVYLFTDELFQLHELLSGSANTILEFDQARILEFGHRLRGRLIDRWISFGREHTANKQETTREIEATERLLKSVIGKNTLPSVPFIILSLLQADQEDKAEVAEAGSFGYLYEVLVTSALSVSKGPKAQLEKKYTFLAQLAYEMFKGNYRQVSVCYVRELAEKYSQSHLVSVDVNAMLADLEDARVLLNIDGNYSFAYWHLFYYFIARYYRDNLDRQVGLHEEINKMVDSVSSNEYSAILMFVVYFARDSIAIVKRLVSNAERIYSAESPADLDADIRFLNRLCEHPVIDIPDEVDTEANRQERREVRDRIERSSKDLPGRGSRVFEYNDDLSDTDKFDLAYRHIELLGQVIRNFPGSLPGPEKLAILKSTYLLGLRLLRALLGMLESTSEQFRSAMAAALVEHKSLDRDKVRELVDFLLVFISRISTLSVISRVSGSVGVSDLEAAYKETLQLVGRTNASELIDIAIKLDHLGAFPDADIRDLHKRFSTNPFADTILADLVMSHLAVFDVDRRTRQSMGSLFKVPTNTPLLMDPTRKKS